MTPGLVTVKSRFERPFLVTAGLILIAMAAAELMGNQGSVAVQPLDPVSGLSSRYLFWALAGIEAVIGVACLVDPGRPANFGLTFWLASYVLIYRASLLFLGVRSMDSYVSTMSLNFEIPVSAMRCLISLGIVYIWCGSGLLGYLRRDRAASR